MVSDGGQVRFGDICWIKTSMKNYLLACAALLMANYAVADTWECVDSTDGHKYRVSQNVASDVCRKVGLTDSRITQVTVPVSDSSALQTNDIAMKYARSDSFCVKVGKLTATAARVKALGESEKDLLAKNKLHPNGEPKSAVARRIDEITETVLDNMVAYVYTVKLSPESARLVGYQKCLAGDFD